MNPKHTIIADIRGRISANQTVITLALLSFLLTGCKAVVIEEPLQDSIHPDTPEEFRIKFSANTDLSALSVLLNGKEVADSFEIIDGYAYADNNDLDDFTVSGKNILEVQEPSGALPTQFIIDREGPTVHTTNITEGDVLSITGYVKDDIGTQSLLVNEQATDLDEEGYFSVDLQTPNDNSTYQLVTFTATDLYERESTTTYAHPILPEKSAMLPNTIGASVTDFGINFIIDEVVEPFLTTLDLTSGLKNKELASTNGSVGYAWVKLNNVSHGTPTIGLDTLARSNNGAIRSEVHLPTITISVTAAAGTHPINVPDIPGVDLPWPLPDIPPIITPDIPGVDIVIPASPTLSNVRYKTTANLSLVNKELNISLSDSSLSLGPLDLSAFSALNSIFSQVNFSLENVLEDFIDTAIQEELPGLIPDVIAPLWVDTDAQGETSGKIFGTDVDVSTLRTQSSSFDFGLDTNIVPLSLAGVPNVLGSVYQAATLPTLDGTTPTGHSYHAALVLTETLLNQTLLAAYHNGLTHVTVSADTIELGDIDGIETLSLTQDDTLLLTITPLAASSIAFNEIDGAMFDLSQHQMGIEISTQRNGEIKPLFSATADLSVPLDLYFNNGEKLSTNINGIPEVSISHLAFSESQTLPIALPQALLDYLIVKAIPSLSAGIDIIPLPEFSGYRIGSPALWLTEGKPAFLVLAGDLEKTSTP